MRIRDFVLVASLVPIASAAHGFQATTPLALQRAAGHYEGTATSGPGREAVSADLRVVGGTLVGTLSAGDGPIAVTGGTLAGDVLALEIGMGGVAGTITATLKGGRLDGEWAMGGMSGRCSLRRTGDVRAAGGRPAQANEPQPFTSQAKLEIVVPDFPAQGLILDIGGGGEGVIAQLKGQQVVAIDLSKQELDDEHTSILFPLHVKLPANDVDTGHGAPFRDGQGADHFVTLAERAGFEVVSRRDEAGWFFMEVKKKAREPIRPAAP